MAPRLPSRLTGLNFIPAKDLLASLKIHINFSVVFKPGVINLLIYWKGSYPDCVQDDLVDTKGFEVKHHFADVYAVNVSLGDSP